MPSNNSFNEERFVAVLEEAINKVKTEEDVLSKLVVTSVLRFKDMVLDEKRNELTRQIMETQDVEDQFALLVKKKKLDDLRIRINNELGIVIAK